MKRSSLAAPHDHGKTMKLFLRAANRVYTRAQFAAGQNLIWGNIRLWEKTDTNDAEKQFEAYRFTRCAAERGYAMAQWSLGEMYEEGIAAHEPFGLGVEVDYAEALKWYHKAAEQGSAMGQFALGKMFRAGRGVPQDHLQAHMWFSLAAAHYSTKRKVNAAMQRDKVAKRMTPDQIAEAQRLEREWLAQHAEHVPDVTVGELTLSMWLTVFRTVLGYAFRMVLLLGFAIAAIAAIILVVRWVL